MPDVHDAIEELDDPKQRERIMEELKRLVAENIREMRFVVEAMSRGAAADHDKLERLDAKIGILLERHQQSLEDHEKRLRELEDVDDCNKKVADLTVVVKENQTKLELLDPKLGERVKVLEEGYEKLDKLVIKVTGMAAGVAFVVALLWKLFVH